MYLEHFALSEPPFKITPVTEFFFSGANRGEVLDALVYAITDSEGIIKISGEVGSGKTMLCRMLLERLPTNIKTIYLANPSLSREELLYAIADGLDLDLEGQRVSLLLQNLHTHLVTKHNQGERCVVLVDEAHAMPLDTLEELRLLYNLQVGKHKLVQIVLFGQPELDAKLEQNNMRQLKDRIVHHFHMQPLSKKMISAYLMFRMHAAGYRGPEIFSPAALNLIDRASNGLMRRVNILADKSLLAAFVENTHRIEARHVQAAIRDSELTPDKHWLNRKSITIAGATALLAMAIAGTGWMLGKTSSEHSTAPMLAQNAAGTIAPESALAPAPIASSPAVSATKQYHDSAPPISGTLLQQRHAATSAMLSHIGKGAVSIQLFYTDDTRPARMERFLIRAQNMGMLSDIYVVAIKINGSAGYRVLYGAYANNAAASEGMKNLPQRYKDAFALTLHELDDD
jgi:type II secretory pathway predicted ATPase ExeA